VTYYTELVIFIKESVCAVTTVMKAIILLG